MGNFFVYVIMLLLNIPRHLLGNCRVSTWVRKAVYLFNIYSNISENIRNIQILILSRKMHSLEISFASWPATLLKLRLWHRCFSVTFARFLRTSFFKEHLWWLLLYLKRILNYSNYSTVFYFVVYVCVCMIQMLVYHSFIGRFEVR